MKIHSFCTGLLGCALLAVSLAGVSAQTASSSGALYQEGLAAYQAENWALALEKFSEVYQRTKNPRAQYYMRNAQLKLSQGPSTVTLEKRLSQIIIPDIEFEQTDVPAALEFLRKKIGEVSQGKVQPNFLFKRDPNRPDLPIPSITIRLSNIPVTELLRYIGEISGTQFRYETHAVVCMPRAAPVQPQP